MSIFLEVFLLHLVPSPRSLSAFSGSFPLRSRVTPPTLGVDPRVCPPLSQPAPLTSCHLWKHGKRASWEKGYGQAMWWVKTRGLNAKPRACSQTGYIMPSVSMSSTCLQCCHTVCHIWMSNHSYTMKIRMLYICLFAHFKARSIATSGPIYLEHNVQIAAIRL